MKFSRRIIAAICLAALLVFCAADSQNALINEMIGIDSLLKRVEQRVSDGRKFSFGDRDIQAVLTRMKKASRDLELASERGTSSVITEASSRYLTALGEIYILYARVAHETGAFSSRFDFDTLNAYDLRLHSDAARPLVVQKPFNARHVSGDLIEFFITSEEKQMAEFLALAKASDEYTYEKLVQFVSVRQAFVNLWALQRVSYSELPTQRVSSCAPSLLSFRVKDGDVRSADAYDSLLALDRYNSLTDQLEGAYQVTQEFSLASADDYYEAMSHLFAPTPEFQAYTQGVAPAQVSQWLEGAAKQVASTEMQDWRADPQNSKKILDSSSLISDDLNSQSIAQRMADAVTQRHEAAAAAEIEDIAVKNLKMEDTPRLRARIDAALNRYVAQKSRELAPRLMPALKSIDNVTSTNKQIYDRIQAKIAELTPIAQLLMPAEHDEQLISEAGAITDNKADAKATQYSKAPEVYIRDDFQFVISDATTLKNHLLGEIEQHSSLWKRLQSDRDAMKGLSSFLTGLDQQSRHLGGNTPQRAQSLLRIAKDGAWNTIKALPLGSGSRNLLTKAFNTIRLLTAMKPADLAPTTQSQRDLVESVISQGYESEPLLGVRWKRSGWFQMKESLLQRLYEEAWSQNQFQSAALGRLVLEALQAAADAGKGKLEDFCQANLGNPKDPRFRNMFLSASHLRRILTSNPNDPKMAAKLKKFDDDLTSRTETRSELLLNKYVDPILTVIFVATLVLIAATAFGPVGLAGALTVLMAVLNFGMATLTGADLYLRLTVDFYQKPAQLEYQDAIASSQISGQDPYSDWETLKKQGFVANTTDRVTVNKNRSTLAESQLMIVPTVAMDAWYGQSIYSGIRSSVGLTGLEKVRSLFDGEIPAFAEIASRPEPRPFLEALHEDGFRSALKEKVAAAYENAKINVKAVAGIAPVYGKFTSEEAAQALRAALAHAISDDAQPLAVKIGPELDDYIQFLKGRLTTSQALSSLATDDSPIIELNLADEVPRDLPLTEVPSLKGRLSWSEAMANPELRKFALIPKSAFRAIRNGRFFLEWLPEYGDVVEEINQLRGRLVARKIADFVDLQQRLAQSAAAGESIADTFASLSDKDLALLEEAAKGPQWLTYGYWSAKLARLNAPSTPLGSLLGIFKDYQEMLRSLRPIDWQPAYHVATTQSYNLMDMRKFFRSLMSRDEILGRIGVKPDLQTLELEQRIEERLYRQK